jgi:hypothetical protein
MQFRLKESNRLTEDRYAWAYAVTRRDVVVVDGCSGAASRRREESVGSRPARRSLRGGRLLLMQCGINATELLIGGGRLQEETRRIDRDGPIDHIGFLLLGQNKWAFEYHAILSLSPHRAVAAPPPGALGGAARRSTPLSSALPVAALASALPRKNLTGDTNADKNNYKLVTKLRRRARHSAATNSIIQIHA